MTVLELAVKHGVDGCLSHNLKLEDFAKALCEQQAKEIAEKDSRISMLEESTETMYAETTADRLKIEEQAGLIEEKDRRLAEVTAALLASRVCTTVSASLQYEQGRKDGRDEVWKEVDAMPTIRWRDWPRDMVFSKDELDIEFDDIEAEECIQEIIIRPTRKDEL